MSEYSTDSLEDAKEISSRNQNSLHGKCKSGSNLKPTKICNVDLPTDLSLIQKRGKGKTCIVLQCLHLSTISKITISNVLNII